MGVKVELSTDKKIEEINYPCLMINDVKDCIVLMTSDRTGTILWHVDPKWVGLFKERYWLMSYFKPYDETLTLSNEQ